MGLFDLFRNKPAITPEMTPERFLELGVFLRDLNKRCDELQIDREHPILSRTTQFLMFGGNLARTIAGATSITPETDHLECAASLNQLTQGVHQFMMQKNGEENSGTAAYKAEWTLVWERGLAHFFGWDVNNPNARGVAIMDLGARLRRKANATNPDLQQRSCDAWADLLSGITDGTATAMGNIYSETYAWAKANQPL
ncbi:hypothetical protein [Rhizobium herbae]|jgi:hypothetical protein